MGLPYRIGIWLDQGLNVVTKLADGWGSPDEMLSARAWRLRVKHPKLWRRIDKAFFWDANHCYECFLIEYFRRQLPKEYREATHDDFTSTNPSPES